MKKGSFLLLPLLAASLFPLPSLAQSTAAPATKPATPEEINLYVLMGSVVSCTLMADQKVCFDKALPAAASMVTTVMLNKHGGQLSAEPGKVLSADQLFQGNFVYIVNADKNICYSKLSAQDQKEIDKVLESFKKSQTNSK